MYTVTELPVSPDDDRRSRMRRYTIMMSIRVVCPALCVVVEGWWLVLPALGAIFLPYLAVVLANLGLPHSFAAVMAAGFTPFIIGGIVKWAIAAALLPLAWMLVRRVDRRNRD